MPSIGFLNLFPDYILGDVDFDGDLGIIDLLYISDMISGIGYSATPPADYNEDGFVNVLDVVAIVGNILGN